MQRLAQAGFQVCLHGHIHKADTDLFRYDMRADGRNIHVVGAGTFGAPAKEWTSGYPLQYNLLQLRATRCGSRPAAGSKSTGLGSRTISGGRAGDSPIYPIMTSPSKAAIPRQMHG